MKWDMDSVRKILRRIKESMKYPPISHSNEKSIGGMYVDIDLDGDKNNESMDLTKKLIEKEYGEINRWQNITKSLHPAYDEPIKAAQLRAAQHDSLIKEAAENAEKSRREEMYRDAAMTRPLIPSPKINPISSPTTQPPTNSTNVIHNPPKQYGVFIQIFIGVSYTLLAIFIFWILWYYFHVNLNTPAP
jgi:hypothetical protein